MTRSGVDDARRNDLFRTLQQALSDSPELAEYLVNIGIDSISFNPNTV
jgi:hypothetical protein